MTRDMIEPIFRHLIQVGAGVLLSKGVIDESAMQQLIGAGMSLFAVGWYILKKRG